MLGSIGATFSLFILCLNRLELNFFLVETDFGSRFRNEEAEMLPKNLFSDIFELRKSVILTAVAAEEKRKMERKNLNGEIWGI